MKTRYIPTRSAILALAALALPLAAQEPKESEKPAPTLTAEEIKLHSGKELLPLPAEVLSVLKIKDTAGWAPSIEEALKRKPLAEGVGSTASAARLGIRGADAFLGLQAKSKPLLDQALAELLPISERLGVDDALITTGQDLKTKVDAADWPAVLALLDSTYSGALKAIDDVGDPESVAIASAAGWLRGTEIFTGAVLSDFKEASAKALRQPELAKSLADALDAIPEGRKAEPAVAGLLAALKEIHGIIDVPTDGSFTKEQVEKIQTIAATALSNL